MKTDILHIRVEPEKKKRVEATLKSLGLTMTDAINIFLSQVALTDSIPFKVRLPKVNPEHVTALIEARRMGLATKLGSEFTSVDEVLAEES